ncbi:MAG TPA: hypothetical protein PLB01_01275 [Thermoanaerobaculia bacterium]|nr:hypothetical protein [Thermoanaerobaculia bacterium]
MKLFRSAGILAAAAMLALAAPAAAQSYAAVKGMDERFRLDLGGFFQNFETTLRLDSAALGRGTEINFEDDLGQDANKTSFRASGYWRFGRHGRFDFGVITWNRSATHTIAKDIQFGDHVYRAGATIDSNLRATQVDAYYAYSFVNTGEAELGLKLGFSALINSTEFNGSGSITGPGGTVSGSRASDSRSVVAPVPAIGAYGRFTLLPGLMISAQARGLPTVTISGYSGSFVDAGAYLDWYPWKNFGFGGGYSYTKITFEREQDPTIRFEYTYSGPIVYVSLAF